MKKYIVEILDNAIVEIENITDYIAEDSVTNALNWYEDITEKIRSLDSMPERCPIADENPYFDFEVHCLLVSDYRVLYRINGNKVEILHIKHPRMNR
ncbi:hypothetical protein MNBD_GAMMA09-3556 [hydrothermal vent metagenome]|uniref:Death on curing protein, Doc toxin n=1 Tax=hydrothermal vent metagenome TaxID=652676 RepID=A0A3B0YG14_9ZZZZ